MTSTASDVSRSIRSTDVIDSELAGVAGPARGRQEWTAGDA